MLTVHKNDSQLLLVVLELYRELLEALDELHELLKCLLVVATVVEGVLEVGDDLQVQRLVKNDC